MTSIYQAKKLVRPLSVSVIVPTYNRAGLLARALHSIYRQTHLPDEVIVVDCNSNDDTSAMLARDFPEIVLIVHPEQNVSAARNAGIAAAKGAWLAFLDSDDEWLPGKLAEQIAMIARSPDSRICHTDEIWIRNGRRVNPMRKHAKYGGWIFQRCLPLCLISPSSVMIHRSVFEDIGGFDASLPVCEDYDLWLRITSRYEVLFIDRPLIVKYGGHADQLSRRYWGMDRFRIQALEKIVASGSLKPADLAAARNTLREKIDIYLLGAVKRGKKDEIIRLEKMKIAHNGEDDK